MKISEQDQLRSLANQVHSISQSPLPSFLSPSDWWQTLQKTTIESAIKTGSILKAIHTAQHSTAQFDHRRKPSDKNRQGTSISSIILDRYQQIINLFPKECLDTLPEESPFSLQETLMEINNKQYSNMFLYHLYFYLRIKELIASSSQSEKPDIPSNSYILELGGGYGGLARIFAASSPHIKYIICDLPESLFFSFTFLQANFPDKKIKLVENESCDYEEFDILLVPVNYHLVLDKYSYKAIINTGSLQEMPDNTIRFWLNKIKKLILNEGLFYSFNYFLNDNKLHMDISGEIMNESCLILDSDWEINLFRINPSLLIQDAENRNWLEFSGTIDLQNSNNIISELQVIPDFTHEESRDLLFKNLWRSHFKNPFDPTPIKLLLKAIDLFKRGKLGLNTNAPKIPTVRLFEGSHLLNPNADDALFPLYGEEIYLENKLAAI